MDEDTPPGLTTFRDEKTGGHLVRWLKIPTPLSWQTPDIPSNLRIYENSCIFFVFSCFFYSHVLYLRMNIEYVPKKKGGSRTKVRRTFVPRSAA
jgi:hypothetical protein